MAAPAPLPSLPSASNLHHHLHPAQQSQLGQHPLDRPASSSLLVGTSPGSGPISRSVASSPSTTSLQLGPRPHSATPSNLQYQSVVAQLAQSHRVSQQVGQQPHLLEGSAASAEPVRSPHHATPSPSSSSTSSASGSGSGTDTIKRGASPASVKFKESSSSYSIKSDTSRILSSSSSLAKKYGSNGVDPSPTASSTLANGAHLQHHASSATSPSTSLLLAGSNGSNGARKRDGNGLGGSLTSNNNNGPIISSSSDLQLPSRSVLFASDYLSSTAPSTMATTTTRSSASPATVPVSSLDVATFSLDEKNNLVVSPSPSSASESSHHSSNSSLRERSPQPSPSLKRQEQFERSDSAVTTSSGGGSGASSGGFMSTLRSQTLGSYQFPSTSLKLTGQLSADAASGSGSGDDGSTSSLLRKLTSSLSRTITSNTGTLPLSLGRQGASSSLYQQDISYSGSSSTSSSSGKPTSASLNYTSPGGSLLGEGGNGGHTVTTAAAVSSMSIYGTLPKNSSIYSYGGSSLLSGTSSSYGISDRLRALTGGSGSDSSSGLGSSLTTAASAGSGAESSAADLGASGYDYESSGFSSSTGLTSSYGGTSASSASMTTSATSGLSSSYFSTGSGTSPFATGATERTTSAFESTTSSSAAPSTYRVPYVSTNPFLPSYNPHSDIGSSNGGGVGGGRNGGLKSSDEDDSFDMK